MDHSQGACKPPAWLRDHPLVSLWFPALFWLAVISYFSSRSALPPPFSLRSRWGAFFRNTAHFGEFAILAALLHRALSGDHPPQVARGNPEPDDPPPPGLDPLLKHKPFAICFTAGLLFAFVDEFHQSLVPNRDFELADISTGSIQASAAT